MSSETDCTTPRLSIGGSSELDDALLLAPEVDGKLYHTGPININNVQYISEK